MNARPTIRLRLNQRVPETAIAHVLHGIEEEGVPVEITRHDELSPLALAHEASLESRLGVGIGISLDYIVVTTEKLPAERPYLVEVLNGSEATDRAVGGNASRLVKRMPLIVQTAP